MRREFSSMHKVQKEIAPLLWFIGFVSVFTPIVSFLLWNFFHIAGPTVWLPLSWAGLQHHYYWQVITYAFVHSPDFSFTLSLLLSTTFNLIMLSFTANEIISRFRLQGFVLIFSFLILSGGIGASLYFYFSKALSPLYGLTPVLFGLFVIWGMLMPTLELSLAFFYRVKVVQLISSGLLLSFFYLVLSGYIATSIAAVCCTLVAFVYAQVIWGLANPYFESPTLHFPKIFGDKESDEAFMERMLTKIHTQGLHSLSKQERERLERVSKKKSN